MKACGVNRLVRRDAALGDDLVTVVTEFALGQIRADLDGDVTSFASFARTLIRKARWRRPSPGQRRRAIRRKISSFASILSRFVPFGANAASGRGNAFERAVFGHFLKLDDLALHAPRQASVAPTKQ